MTCRIEIDDFKETWLPYFREWSACKKCKLRLATPVIYPRGQIPCDVLFVGMNPGISEDALSFPMVGPTQPIIDDWILNGLPFRCRWAIQNLMACVTRDETNIKTRDPSKIEILNCSPRLVRFVEMANPGKIVLLGQLAWKYFPKDNFPGLDYLKLPHPSAVNYAEHQKGRKISADAIVALRKFTGRDR